MSFDIKPPAAAGLAPMHLAGEGRKLAELRAKAEPRERDQIRQAAEDFESLFMNIVLKSMRDTVQKSGLIDGGHAEDVYRSLLDDEYAKMMASQRHTGLADEIERFLLAAVGKANGAEAPASAEKAQGIKAYQTQPSPSGLRPDGKQEKIKDGPPSELSSPHPRGKS